LNTKRFVPTPALAHLAFLESLAGLDEDSPQWSERLAGLLCLRLVDEWWREGIAVVDPEAKLPHALRRAIGRMPPTAQETRGILIGILNTMQALGDADLEAVVPRLFSYGRILARHGDFRVAADVFGAVEFLVDEERSSDIFNDAQLEVGYCLRENAFLGDAERAYARALATASRNGDKHRQVVARIGAANVVRDLGDLPRADEMLEHIIDRCRAEFDRAGEIHALRDLGQVAQRRAQPYRALECTIMAIELGATGLDREKAIANIGQYLVDMGEYGAARRVLVSQERTSKYDGARIRAQINLLAIAVRIADSELFAQWSKELEKATLTPDLRVNVLIELAKGSRVFGDDTAADDLFGRAAAFADAHRLARASFEIEMLRQEGRPAVAEQRVVSPWVEQGLLRLAAAGAH